MLEPLKAQFKKGPVILVSRPIAFTFPLSYAYLAGYLIERGEDVRILFKTQNHLQLVNQIMNLNPLLVGFGNLYPELKEIGEIINMLDRAGRQFPIVIGGQMVTPIPKFAVKVTGADFGVIGEGEIILHSLVSALREDKDPLTVKGLAVRRGDDVILTGSGEVIEDINFLPPVPYDLFPTEQWLPIGRWYVENVPQPHWRFEDRVINVHGGRGCPFACNFCYHHSKARYRKIPQMMAEAAEALERFNGNMLYFSDDLVLATPARSRQLVDAVRLLKKPIQYSVSARFDTLSKIDDSLLSEMKETGCRIMGLGIESGSDRILKTIGKRFTAENVLNGLERLKQAGILPTVSIMVGQQSETKEDVELSIDLMRKSVRSNPNIQYGFSITTPFPGSSLYNLIFEKGYLKDDQEFYERYFSDSKVGDWNYVVNLSGMADEEVIQMVKKINRVYEEEKAKNIKSMAVKVELFQLVFGKINNELYKRIFYMLPQWKTLIFFLQKYNSIYEFVQKNLDIFRLRLRGLT